MDPATDATGPGERPRGVTRPDHGAAATQLQADPPAPAAADDAWAAWIGRTIDDRYRVLELLGEGGMGAVFVAENLNLRKQVALKVIRAEFAADPQIAARFAREAMATAKLDHPHIVSALDYGALPEGGAYLVIQLVRGRSLRAVLERRALAWPQACAVVAQIADALATAHQAGIVHRDLKPDNVLIEPRGDGGHHVRVVDFGIARIAGELQSHHAGLTRTGMVMGTPGYMAPEQAMGEEVDLRADLYALGVVLWECVAGRPLWNEESLTELLVRQLGEAPPPLQAVLGHPVPELLDQLIAQLVTRTPGARPESAAPIRDALKKLALSAGDAALAPVTAPGLGPARRTEIAPTVLTAARPAPWAQALAWLRADRRRLLAVAGAALLLLVLPLTLRGRPAAPEAPPAAADAPGAPASDPGTALPATPAEPADAPSDDALAHIDIVLHAADGKARAYSARKLRELADAEPIPPAVLHVAELELAGGKCAAKKPWVEALAADRDPRALPALRRLAAAPRDGCGNLFNRVDCYGCLRKALDAAIQDLQDLQELSQATP